MYWTMSQLVQAQQEAQAIVERWAGRAALYAGCHCSTALCMNSDVVLNIVEARWSGRNLRGELLVCLPL
jgi:hypothetical protein